MAVSEASDFNRHYPVGTTVRYWPSTLRGKSFVAKTRTPAWTLGDGTAVVSVEGYAGGISLSHIVITLPAALQSQVHGAVEPG